MKRLTRLYVAVLLVACALLSTRVAAGTRANNTCDVPGQYATIQAAVDDAACETIGLGAGTFYENVTISRTVTLQGQGVDQTFVDGSSGWPSLLAAS
jgi:pectin methylesterase-like acyl-CoA thioesterase